MEVCSLKGCTPDTYLLTAKLCLDCAGQVACGHAASPSGGGCPWGGYSVGCEWALGHEVALLLF